MYFGTMKLFSEKGAKVELLSSKVFNVCKKKDGRVANYFANPRAGETGATHSVKY